MIFPRYSFFYMRLRFFHEISEGLSVSFLNKSKSISVSNRIRVKCYVIGIFLTFYTWKLYSLF